MNETSPKTLVILAGIILILIGVSYMALSKKWSRIPFLREPVVLTEKITLPDSNQVTNTDGFHASEQGYKVPLTPEDEGQKVIVNGATHSPFTSYELTKGIAKEWSEDAKLSIIKSLGTVTLEGVSSGWQVIYVSKIKGLGYEIIIDSSTIVRSREIPSASKGGDVPVNFNERDAVWAIHRLAENPQWSGAVMTGLNLAYNPDAKAWDYIISTTYGGSSVRIR